MAGSRVLTVWAARASGEMVIRVERMILDAVEGIGEMELLSSRIVNDWVNECGQG
jgi:hypothetical protein